MSRGASLRRRSSKPTRSASSTTTLPKCGPKKASSISLSPSIRAHEKATTKGAAEFLRHLIAAVPYKTHTVLTDNGIHFHDTRRWWLDCRRDQRRHRKRRALPCSRFRTRLCQKRYRPSADQTKQVLFVSICDIFLLRTSDRAAKSKV